MNRPEQFRRWWRDSVVSDLFLIAAVVWLLWALAYALFPDFIPHPV